MKPPELSLKGNTICAGPKVEDVPGAGATLNVTFLYALYWCRGAAPASESARRSQLDSALQQFACEGAGPIRCASADATALVYTVDEFRELGTRNTANAVLSSTGHVEYVIQIDPA